MRLSRWSRGLAPRYAHGIIYYCGNYACSIKHFYYVTGIAFYGTFVACYYEKKYFAASFGPIERRRRLWSLRRTVLDGELGRRGDASGRGDAARDPAAGVSRYASGFRLRLA